jgi:hypothetical protein
MSGRSEAGRRGQARGEFSRAQRAGLDARQADQDRTLVAMHALEAALGEAAPGREQDWHQSVLSALAVLDEATIEAAANAERPDSLLSDIARTSPGYATGREACACSTATCERRWRPCAKNWASSQEEPPTSPMSASAWAGC